ncbi:CAP domain-containing protein [Streptomyces sp. NPDC013740]|uniref:CAP domain-containing protein n=1 Tax=Streptomyces sp. NPDC013740 TaxID=3364867 RepID=UPI0036FB6EB3
MQHDAHDADAPTGRPGRPPERGGGRGRHRRGTPSFRWARTAAGAVAAALVVASGVYVTTLGTPAGAGTPPVADTRLAPAPVADAVPAVAGSAGSAGQYVDQIVALVNTEREKAGCSPLRSDAKLRTAAQEHADDMSARHYYAHESPEGRNAGDRISAAGYTWSTWGENIHRGPHTPAQAVEDWMNSEGHRRNILNCAFEDIGVGVTLAANGPWWVQDFASR